MQLSETLAGWGHRKRFDRREVSQATPHLQLLEETAVKLWQQQAGKMGHIRKGWLDKSYVCTQHLHALWVWISLKINV